MNWFHRAFGRPRPARRGGVTLMLLALEPRDVPAGGWEPLAAVPASADGATAYLHPDRYRPFDVDPAALRKTLDAAPADGGRIGADALTLTLPGPDGRDQRFAVVDSPVMAPELAAEFPDIETFRGQGIDDPTATLRLDLTPQGLHAQVLSAAGTWYIDPYYHLETDVHISYFRRDLQQGDVFALRADGTAAAAADAPVGPGEGLNRDNGCGCLLCTGAAAASFGPAARHAWPDGSARPPLLAASLGGPEKLRSGATLRTYRAAVAATGEYTAFHGGTVALGQAAIVTAMNRVVGVYETELAIRMVLVAGNSSLVYTNAGTDPYTNSSGSTMLGQNQTNVTSVIGTANYDIGHVFSTGGGGVAGLGVVGRNTQKARGVTGRGAPVGDAFTIDYVAHEIGHQFGANHTFNTSSDSNRNAATAYEPGSGSTVMAYAGITGSNSDLQGNSDPYFNTSSFDEIIAYVDNTIPAVGTRTATGNSVPTVSAGPATYVIPAGTPFELTAAGADADGDPLTYSWEQRNLGPAALLNAADNGSSPLFRVYNPTASPTRTFPRLADLVNNVNTIPRGEKLPTVDWAALRFRVTARDNRSAGGGVNTADTAVRVVNTGSAFAVTAPNTAVTWVGNSAQTVTWNVAGTASAPISAALVNLRLSLDGGLTYPVLLAAGVPNSGSAAVTVPNVGTAAARVRVQPADGIFFDISNANFTIAPVPAVAGVTLNGGDAQRSRLRSVAVAFDSTVTVGAGAFQLTRVGGLNGAAGDAATLSSGGATPQVSVSTATVGGVTVATLTFTGGGPVEAGSLGDGVWRLTVVGSAVTRSGTAMPADYTTPAAGAGRIARLFGDADGNGTADGADASAFGLTFNRAAGDGGFNAALDADGNGVVDAADASAFGLRFNRSV